MKILCLFLLLLFSFLTKANILLLFCAGVNQIFGPILFGFDCFWPDSAGVNILLVCLPDSVGSSRQ